MSIVLLDIIAHVVIVYFLLQHDMNEKMLITTLTRTTAPFHDDERLNGYDKKPAPTRPADGFGIWY